MRTVRKSWAIIGSTVMASYFCAACVRSSTDMSFEPGAAAGKTPALNAMTYLAHGHLLERQGDFKRAVEQYRQALIRQPRFPTAQNRLGITLNKLARHAEASQVFRDAIEAKPGRAHLQNNLGFSLLLEGKYTQSEAALRRSLELNGGFKRARMNHGIVLAKLGRHDEAFHEFALVGSDADAHYNLAMVQADAGMYAQACEALRRTLELRPDMKAAQAQLERLTLQISEPEVELAVDVPQEASAAAEVPTDSKAQELPPMRAALPGLEDAHDEIKAEPSDDEQQTASADDETDMSAALERAFAGHFGDPDEDSNAGMESEVETIDRPAVHLPAETAVTAVIEPQAPADLIAEPEFEWPEAKMIADAPPSPVTWPAVEYDVWLAEIAPIISLVADILTLPDSVSMGELDAPLNEFQPVEADAPEMTSEAVQESISALLVEAEYMAELLFAIQDDIEPDHAFELTSAIDAIISEQLMEVTVLDEWRCELLDQEMAFGILSGD